MRPPATEIKVMRGQYSFFILLYIFFIMRMLPFGRSVLQVSIFRVFPKCYLFNKLHWLCSVLYEHRLDIVILNHCLYFYVRQGQTYRMDFYCPPLGKKLLTHTDYFDITIVLLSIPIRYPGCLRGWKSKIFRSIGLNYYFSNSI